MDLKRTSNEPLWGPHGKPPLCTYMIELKHPSAAVDPSLTSSAAVSGEPRQLVATPWTIFFVDLLVLLFLILPVPVWLPASVVGFAVGLG